MPSASSSCASSGDVHELLITHNFVIGWFVREVLQAPEWRWMSAQPGALRADGHRAAAGPSRWTLVSHNDLAHLPVELRTGLPDLYSV